ncbi:hypothetical protein [Lutispora sp.]|uniref:hypothetical protein n=1 Tax=Lutispora sp. TaxID=2828727 RepID=UPI002B21AB49|nr:hypothetical protein [Lutispora sp.]MEA4964147.1 hypothetical protein [Lutispora sp.]
MRSLDFLGKSRMFLSIYVKIIENYCIKQSTLTGIVIRLEKGLVKRGRSEGDRKAVYLNCAFSGQDIARKHIEERSGFF